MPNWTSNYITFEGNKEEIKRLKKEIGSDIRAIDFNNIVPQPTCIRKTPNISGPLAEEAKNFYTEATKNHKNPLDLLNKNEIPQALKIEMEYWDANRNRILQGNIKDKEEPNWYKYSAKETTENYLECMKKTGYVDWYKWNIENWGTKWNAWSNKKEEEAKDSVQFYTAWCAPVPIFEALAKKYKNIRFIVEIYGDYDEDYYKIEYHYNKKENKVKETLLTKKTR